MREEREERTNDEHRIDRLIGEFLKWRASVGTSRNTISNDEKYLRAWAFKAVVERKHPGEVHETDVGTYVNDDSKAKASSRKIRLSHISSFFRYLNAKGICQNNPAKLVRVDMSKLSHKQKEKKVIRVLTEDEYRRVVDYVDPKRDHPDLWWYFAVVFGRHTGLRLSDIAQLERDCISDNVSTITVWNDKRDKRVELPMNVEMTDCWADVMSLSIKDSLYVFPYRAHLARTASLKGRLSAQFAKLMKRLNIKGISFHSLRHTYITDAYNRGVRLEHIANAVGHSSVNQTKDYVVPTLVRRRIIF